MEKIFLLIFLFTLASSKIDPYIKLGAKYSFDLETNSKFKLRYKGPGNDGFLLYIDSEVGITYSFSCVPGGFKFSTNSGANLVSFEEQRMDCDLQFGALFESSGNGTFIIHSLKNEIKIKLKNIYGDLAHPLSVLATDFMVEDLSLPDISYITYSVPNLERDVMVTFDYNGNCGPFTIEENPFKVCHNNDCKENIETYDFQKGESYTIMVKLQKIKNPENSLAYYVLPGYTFHDINYNGIDSDDDIIVDDIDDDDDKGKGSYSNKITINLFFISLIILLL